MEKDIGSCFQPQHSRRQLANLNSLHVPFDLGLQNTVPTYMGPYTNMVPPNGGLSVFPFSGLLHSKASQSNEPQPHGWFYCLPRYRQGLTPLPSSVLKERVPTGPYEKRVEAVTPNPVSGCAQKRFLVFDQSGDQTTLIFSSGIGTPVNCPTSWMPKPPSAYNMLNKDEAGIKMDNIHHSGPNFSDEYNENHGDYSGSEMREDTEELNALLYSDDDDNYSEDGEETSTGHSPSTMTAYEREEWSDESAEEVDSCVETMKRRKLLDGGFDVSSLMDRGSTVKTNRCFKYEDDAESSCADEKNTRDFSFPAGDKRLKKEKIRETVSILQNIVPGGKGKEAIVVLEEAINYLKSLKRKAKALGLDSL